jgi:hypothetical protein
MILLPWLLLAGCAALRTLDAPFRLPLYSKGFFQKDTPKPIQKKTHAPVAVL